METRILPQKLWDIKFMKWLLNEFGWHGVVLATAINIDVSLVPWVGAMATPDAGIIGILLLLALQVFLIYSSIAMAAYALVVASHKVQMLNNTGKMYGQVS